MNERLRSSESTVSTKGAQTRQRLLDAAQDLFAEQPFDAVTVRAIATQAGVDPALINHYFGSKEGLFGEVIARITNPDSALGVLTETPQSRWGYEIVRYADTVWSSPTGKALLAVFRRGLSGNPEVLQASVRRIILDRLTAHLNASDQQLRASLAASQMVGVIVARHIVHLEPMASLTTEELVDLIGPTIQRYLTGNLTAS